MAQKHCDLGNIRPISVIELVSCAQDTSGVKLYPFESNLSELGTRRAYGLAVTTDSPYPFICARYFGTRGGTRG